MAEPKKYTEDEAYGMLQTALLTGQDALDSLPDDVKKMALGAAERSLAPGRGGYDLTKEELESPDREGFTPVVEPPEPTTMPKLKFKMPQDLSDDVIDTVNRPLPRKGYELTKEELASPAREGFTPVVSPPREEYKGFMAPSGMSAEQTAAWKAGIDDRLLDKPERIQERIEGEHPKEQLMDIIRRASEGDMEAIKDMGYFGLNVASMVGPQQAAADLGVGAMDLAERDYAGAAISGAAAVLPLVSAGMAKQIMNKDFGEEARDFLINHGQIGYEIEQALVKSQGKVTDAIKELQEYQKSLGDNVMKAIQDSPDIAPMDMAKLDSDLMDATGHSLDDIIEAAKQGKTLPTEDEMLYKSAQHRSTDPWEKDTFVSDQQKAYEAEMASPGAAALTKAERSDMVAERSSLFRKENKTPADQARMKELIKSLATGKAVAGN